MNTASRMESHGLPGKIHISEGKGDCVEYLCRKLHRGSFPLSSDQNMDQRPYPSPDPLLPDAETALHCVPPFDCVASYEAVMDKHKYSVQKRGQIMIKGKGQTNSTYIIASAIDAARPSMDFGGAARPSPLTPSGSATKLSSFTNNNESPLFTLINARTAAAGLSGSLSKLALPEGMAAAEEKGSSGVVVGGDSGGGKPRQQQFSWDGGFTPSGGAFPTSFMQLTQVAEDTSVGGETRRIPQPLSQPKVPVHQEMPPPDDDFPAGPPTPALRDQPPICGCCIS